MQVALPVRSRRFSDVRPDSRGRIAYRRPHDRGRHDTAFTLDFDAGPPPPWQASGVLGLATLAALVLGEVAVVRREWAKKRNVAYAGAAALVGGLVLITACGGGGEDRPASTPFNGLDGRVLYGQACASCHGADLQGTEQGPTFIDSIYRSGHHADSAFPLAVRRGVRSHHWGFGNMPPIDGLTHEQVEAIVQYVREQQRQAGID